MELSRIKVCVCVCVFFCFILILSSKMSMKCISIIISHFSDQKLANLFMSMKKTRNVQFNLMSMSNDILFTFDHFHLNFLYFISLCFTLLLLFLSYLFFWFLCVYNTTFMISYIDLIAFSLIFLFNIFIFLFLLLIVASLYLREHFSYRKNSYFLFFCCRCCCW